MEIVKLYNKNATIDFKSNQITFLDQRFYRTESGAFVPSVTTILEAYPKTAEYYTWLKKMGDDADTVRDDAGKRGSTVHVLTERYDAGEEINLLDKNGFVAYTTQEWAMLHRYAEFIERFKPEALMSEMNIVSATLGYAGTLDRVMIVNEKTYLVDIKTSNAIYPSYWLQLAAYEQLIIEAQGYNIIEGVAILWLNSKTRTNGVKGAIQGPGWQFVTKDDTSNDLKQFHATKVLWEAQNENVIPKQSSYQLKIRKNGSY